MIRMIRITNDHRLIRGDLDDDHQPGSHNEFKWFEYDWL